MITRCNLSRNRPRRCDRPRNVRSLSFSSSSSSSTSPCRSKLQEATSGRTSASSVEALSSIWALGLMWLRIRGQVLSVFVPKGLMIVARQFIAWNACPIENPSRRARSDPWPGLIDRPNGGRPIGPNHTVPYGTVPFSYRYQAINCLATIISPFGTTNLLSTFSKPYQVAEAEDFSQRPIRGGSHALGNCRGRDI